MPTSTTRPASFRWRLSRTGVPRLVVPKRWFFSRVKASWFSQRIRARFFSPTLAAISPPVMGVWMPRAGMSRTSSMAAPPAVSSSSRMSMKRCAGVGRVLSSTMRTIFRPARSMWQGALRPQASPSASRTASLSSGPAFASRCPVPPPLPGTAGASRREPAASASIRPTAVAPPWPRPPFRLSFPASSSHYTRRRGAASR